MTAAATLNDGFRAAALSQEGRQRPQGPLETAFGTSGAAFSDGRAKQRRCRSQAVDPVRRVSRICRSFCCWIDDLRVLDVEFLRKVDAMQDSLAAANRPRCGPMIAAQFLKTRVSLEEKQ